MRASYPMLLDVTERTIVIVGGGAVAARKARGLLQAGATRIRCVAPEFAAEIPAEVERVRENYRPDHLDGATLVFAATDVPTINEAIVRDCRQRKVLVNRADPDDESPGDFTNPAVLQRGEVIVTVAASSPALAARIRDELADRFDPAWQQMADAMGQLRPMIKASRRAIGARRRIFRDLASDEALAVLRKQGKEALLHWLRERHPELTDA